MSTYVSFAASNVHFDSHASMSSSRRQALKTDKIAAKKASSSPSSLSSSPTQSTSTSTSSSSISFKTTFDNSSPCSTSYSENSSPFTLSSSTAALSLLSNANATRSSISPPEIVLEDVTYFDSSSSRYDDDDDDAVDALHVRAASRSPVEHLNMLVRRYDDALLATAAEREVVEAAAAAHEAKLAAHAAQLQELCAKQAAAQATKEAERVAALLERVRLSPSPYTEEEIRAMYRNTSGFRHDFRTNRFGMDFDTPIWRKAVQYEHQKKTLGYVEDVVLDCWLEGLRMFGHDLTKPFEGHFWHFQYLIEEAESFRKSTLDKKNRPLYKKVLSFFC